MSDRHSSKCHAAQFVSSLNSNQRNALRVILLGEHGCTKLRRALGTSAALVVTEQQRRTGLACSGRTIELFDEKAAIARNVCSFWVAPVAK
jgi:hypothetical protein